VSGKFTVYNFEVADNHDYFVGKKGVLVHNADYSDAEVGRHGAFREAKRDAGIPMPQQPDSISRVQMTDMNGKAVLGSDGRPITTREYSFTRKDGTQIIIQDHSAGHSNFGEGPHFNVRPTSDTRHGTVSGARKHYRFRLKR
jgi:hypothetical protein